MSRRAIWRKPAVMLGRFALLGGLLSQLQAQTPIPGKYYEYYTIAKTGTTFTSLGSSPSINWFGDVAFQASTAAGNGLWFGSQSTTLTNFNPGESFSSSDIIQPGVQINSNDQVVSEDRITTTSPATTSIRRYVATVSDLFSYIARGGPSRAYNAVFANPSINDNGDVVFTADDGSLPAKVLGYVASGSGTVVAQHIYAPNPKPMIANNGTVAISVGGTGAMASNYQIQAYVQPFSNTPIVIADTNNGWVSLDNDPGISKDGHIIVFQGSVSAAQGLLLNPPTTPGPGIFAAIDTGTGFANATIVRVTGTMVEDITADAAANHVIQDGGVCVPSRLQASTEICKAAAELGFDSNGNAITIFSYPTDSRVGVMNVDFGAPGIANDSFVISFLATPLSASRTNPALPGTPLIFSSQLGLWTIRVDSQFELAAPTVMAFHPFTPIPVVQVGDKIGSDTITGLSVYDPIAPAAYDEAGNIRTMRRGDHRVTFWASTNNGQVILRGNHLDSDQDGLLDHWETTGIDMDQDGTVDLKLSTYGASPFVRDLFIQVDWVGMPGTTSPFQPAGGLFSSDVAGQYSGFEANFRNAQALSGAMYGATADGSAPADIVAGVIPHVDGGTGLDSLNLPISINLGTGTSHGGNSITMPGGTTLPAVVYMGQPGVTSPGVNVRAFQDIRDNYFGLSDKNARLLTFHYMVFAPFQDFKPNIPATPQTNSITAIDAPNEVDINPLPNGFTAGYIMVTSGPDAGDVLSISAFGNSTTTPGNDTVTTHADFKVAPNVNDTIVFLEGSSGISEVAFAASPDNNSLPGSGVIVSAGALGVLTGVPINQCKEWRTAAHEMGHDLGLRHGGTDHTTNGAAMIKANYLSIMNYTFQLRGCPTSAVQSYSNSNTVFNDYANLQFNFADVQFYVSTALGEARGEGTITQLAQMDPEQTLNDLIAETGPLDVIPPTVTITSPSAGSGAPLGSTITVNITATDDIAIDHVTANFDINGDGIMQTGEAIMATQTGANTYQAVFTGVSGPTGLRAVSAIGWDSSANTTLATRNVNVGGTSSTPANIAASGGTPQSVPINTAFPTALQATVTDASSSPVSGVSVTFSAPTSGASGTFSGGLLSASVTTNSSGVATAPTFTANATAGGPYTVTATVSGVATPANFSLTNTAGLTAPAQVSPTNGATAVALAASLNWNASSGATSYDVHLGTTSTPPLLLNTTSLSYNPGALAPSTTYYWYIVAKNGSATAPSPTWSFTTQGPATGLQFYPVTPCRLVDTRGSLVGFNGIAPFNGPSIASGATLTIPVQSATEATTNTAPAPCGTIPSTALAYSLNITAVPQNGGAVDYVSLWPSGSTQPFVATFNDPQGQIVANAAIVPAGTPSGGISIYNAGPSTTDIVIDMNGYFAATTTQGSTTGLQFFPVSPCRLIDTRGSGGGFNGISPFSGPSINGAGTATFPVQSSAEATADTTPAPCGSIPSTAQAYSINTTAVPHAAGAVDYISLWPSGTAQPFVSTFNDPQGQIVANAAIVPAGTPSGGVSVYNAGPSATDIVIDMNGYFAVPTGLKFYPVSPCRLVDTRGSVAGFNGIAPFSGPSIAAGGTLTIPVQSATEASTNTTPAPCGVIPTSAQAYSLNLTVVPHAPGAVNYVSMWPAGSAQPFVATLNDPEGLIVANAAIVPAGTPSGGISVYNAGPSVMDVVIDMNGYFAP